MRGSAFLFALFLASVSTPAFADPAPAATLLSVDAGQSKLTYHLVHKFHKFDGVSKKVEGKARILPDGQAQVGVRAPIESFDSGNANRDAHMKEVTDAAKYPTIELKAAGAGLTPPTQFPTTVDKTFQGELSFHGVKKILQVPVKVTFEAPGKVSASAHFNISLDEFKIERPSLMFVKVDDTLVIDVSLVFKG